jgi:nucleotide-binding universal stress UspA family protein
MAESNPSDAAPVSTAPDADVHKSHRKRTVIIAVDRSQQAEHAFDWYVKALHKPENHLVLIHVPEGATLEMAKGQRMSLGEVNKLMEIERKENEEMTSKYKKLMEDGGVKGEYRVVYGKPGEALVDAAKSDNASMIVMGTRGMGTVRRTIMGSVSDYVVHHAHIPVVVCRHHH